MHAVAKRAGRNVKSAKNVARHRARSNVKSVVRIHAPVLHREEMKKILFVATLPVWAGYLGYGVVHYIRKKDDVHFAALGDIIAWFLDLS